MNAHMRNKLKAVESKWDAKSKAPKQYDGEKAERPEWMKPASKCKLNSAQRRLAADELVTDYLHRHPDAAWTKACKGKGSDAAKGWGTRADAYPSNPVDSNIAAQARKDQRAQVKAEKPVDTGVQMSPSAALAQTDDKLKAIYAELMEAKKADEERKAEVLRQAFYSQAARPVYKATNKYKSSNA